ncbi:SIR2 family NAD-dependent protein deacylase [Miltoncostaea oceani]|uniref:SIR2 family NAD-dependent protein deacylase n=1 Tax=Miltoncostaea oceani TaxID=2843216 RepID=UPI001C3CA9D4|nr:SIR2 family protein [Miltoncostaea oceani]
MEGVRQFAEEATAALKGAEPLHCRERHLVAVPVVGTGAGGGRAVKGDVIRLLLETLDTAAARNDIDVVLVTGDGRGFAAAQSARRQVVAAGGEPWSGIDPVSADTARELAADALAGRLVLFLGAGVGLGAGLPLWGELLDRLAARAGITSDERDEMRRRLTPTDRALIIERRLEEQGQRLGEAVAVELGRTRCSLTHQLLAGLPVREAATMNYDELFENAWRAAGRQPAVLPYEPTADHDSWLLKMHGTVTEPKDIVLTRDDYLRYAERRAALAGIVQALLITRRMLFVGFSLADENFHRIAHDVRQALGSVAEKSTFATTLLLKDEPLLEELWRGDVNCIAVTPDGSDSDPARELEIFLDYLLFCSSSNSGHLLDPSFEGVLTPAERALRHLLTEMYRTAPDHAKDAAAWTEVTRLLRHLGFSVESES